MAITGGLWALLAQGIEQVPEVLALSQALSVAASMAELYIIGYDSIV